MADPVFDEIVLPEQEEGLLVPGNIDLDNRPVVLNADGTFSTVRSMSANLDGKEVLIPTVSDDGSVMSNDDTITQYQQTGRHLGMFDSPERATAYAEKLHQSQATNLKFDEIVLPHASGQFEEIIIPPKPKSETEKAMLETPAVPTPAPARADPPGRNKDGWYIEPGSLPDRIITWFGGGTEALARAEANRTISIPAERPPLALPIAKAIDAAAGAITGQPPVLAPMVEQRTQEPKPEGPSFLNAGIPMVGPQEGTAAQIAAGVANLPIGFANFLLSPGGVATMQGLGMMPKLVQTLVGLGFTAEQVKGFVEAETLQDKITTGVGAAFLGTVTGIQAKQLRKPASEPGPAPATTERAVPETPQGVEPAAAPEAVRAAPEAAVSEPAPSTGLRGGLITKRFGELFRDTDGAIDMSAFSEGVGRSIKEALARGQEVELIADLHINQPKTIPIVDFRNNALIDGKNQPWGTLDLLTGGSEVRIKPKVQPDPIGTTEAISEIQRRNAPSTEPVIPTEPAGTKFAEPVDVPHGTVPENLRRSPEIDRLINEPAAQTGPQIKFEPATEGGALGSGGGKRATVAPKGATPKGDTEFLRIEPGYKRVLSGLEREGAADVIGRTKNKVGKLLSDATRKHVDLEQEIYGNLSSQILKATKGVDKKAVERGFDEVAGYLAAKENGRPLPTLSPVATKLVNAWENIAETTGQISAANNVQVFDPVLGAHRPMHVIGRKYVPRMLKPEVDRAMRDPDSNPRLWNDLVDEFARSRGVTEQVAATELRAQSGRFSSNDFMGNLEMARTGKLPEVFYDYDLRNLAARYIPGFSERMAQIIAYGQRLGPREAPQRPNLWDIAREESANGYTQDWLNNAENQATNLKLKGASSVGMARAQTLASGLLLSSPTTTVIRNTLGGLSATPELLGIRRSIRTLGQAAKSAQARMDAKEIGVVRDNIGDFLHADRLGDSPVDTAIRSIVDSGLKYSGYNGSEVFVRTHGMLTASQFAKDAVAALAKRPTSIRSKEALGLFKRMGINAEKIVAEGADWRTGPETRRFIRTVVRDSQGGYRFDQVPLWANSNMGRFFYQFGRWGTQRSRNIWKNAVQPALGETVQWKGKTMTRRDIRPLVKMLAGTVVLGETFAGIAQVLFGRDRRDASLSEIATAWQEDEKKAVGLALQRAMNDVIMAGTLGIWSQPVDWAKSLKGQTRLKNPSEPPGLGSIKAFMGLAQDWIDQGFQVTKRDLLKFAAGLVPGVKQVTDVARNVMDEPLYEAENDVKTLRSAAHRWGEQAGLDVSPRSRGDFRKSAMAPEYEPIKEALLVGDAQRAKFLAQVFYDSQPDKKKAEQSLKASIRQSQPFRAGPYTAKVHQDNFYKWAKRNLTEDDLKQAERIQERYKRAAEAAKLWGGSVEP